MNGHERSGHGWVAGQEQRLSLLQGTGEPVADGVGAQVRSVVSHSYDYRAGYVVTWNSNKTVYHQYASFFLSKYIMKISIVIESAIFF